MELNKRGIFFTFAAIALSLIIILSFDVYKTYEMKEKVDVVGVRINSVNNFIKDMEQDMEKGLFIAGFRSFTSMVDFIASNGTFISNVENGFSELVLNGTIDNQALGLMKDSTFTDWANKIKVQADKIDIAVNFTILGVSINQTDAWTVSVDADVNISVGDKKGTSSWKRDKSIITKISIKDFEDPLYVVNSIGRVTNTIVKTPITAFDGDDVTNLLIHLNSSYYLESSTAPNFLMRLEGDLSNSSTGIESLVNLEEFQDKGLVTKDRSVVDYIYFGTQSTSNCGVDDMPEWFKIDSQHLETYQVECA